MTAGIPPKLLEALNTLLSFHTRGWLAGEKPEKLEIMEEAMPSDTDPENRRRYHDAWRVVAEAAASKGDSSSAK